jgi:hypothetical protein
MNSAADTGQSLHPQQESDMNKQTDQVQVQLSKSAVCRVSLGAMKSPFLARQQSQPQVQLRTAPACKVSLGAMRSPYLTRQQRG